MKILLIVLLISIIMIGSCIQDNNSIESGAKIGSLLGNDLTIEMYMFPPPDFLIQDTPISLKYKLTNLGESTIIGNISVEDTPDNQQFGGIIEPAISEFSLNPLSSGDNKLDLLVPGTQDITYNQGLNFTSFVTNVEYSKDTKTSFSNFCLKYSTVTDAPKCLSKGTLKSISSKEISSLNYEYLSSNQDKINDKMTLDFDIKDSCHIMTKDENIKQNIDVSLKNIPGVTFMCDISSDSGNYNLKHVTCINQEPLDLNVNNPYYQETVLVKFKYDCKLTLESGFINFKRGG